MIASPTADGGGVRQRLPSAAGLARLALGGLLLVGLVALALRSRPAAAPLPGTDLGGQPSPDFRLTDYRGVAHDLAGLRGRPVVLAFLYTECPDLCRLTTAGLAEAARELGPAAAGVAFVGVSVDPAGDDPSSVRRFLTRQGVADRLIYLTGPPDELARVWGAYYVHADPATHTDAIYLIDAAGRQRSLLRSDFDPSELASALRALLDDRIYNPSRPGPTAPSEREVTAYGGLSMLGLGVAAAVALLAYGGIVRSTGRSPRELAWTLLPALLLATLVVWTVLSR
jgi:protein SCO1/2